MARTNRTCVVCGGKYFYCPTCSTNRLPSWYATFDGEDCKKIFKTCIAFNMGHITATEAKAELAGIKLGGNYSADVKDALDRIEKEAKKAKKEIMKEL